MRWIAVLIGVLTFAAASPASAETFTVTSTNDVTGTCVGGACPSIRAALAAAQFNGSGTDTIVVPAGDYALVQGSLTVDTPVIVNGAGARSTVIRGSAQLPDRIFAVGATTATISSLTMSGGNVLCCDSGGNLLNTGGNVLLDHVRVTGGHGGEGGGVANVDGTMTIRYSLIDGNDTLNHDSDGSGGGVYNVGPTLPATLTMHDSTVVGNLSSFSSGGGIYGGLGSTTTLDRVTLVGNVARQGTGGGIAVDQGAAQVRGSIVAGNVIELPSQPSVISNCLGPVSSLGANVVGATDCGFVGAGDVQGVDPQLGALTNAGGQTDVLPLVAGSPAIDRAGGCSAFDQRDVARPQGVACDSGAFEVNVAPTTQLTTTPSPSGGAPTFVFSSTDPGTRFECRLDGPGGEGAFVPCTSPQTYSGLAPGTYRFFVRAVDPLGLTDPSPPSTTFTIPAGQGPPPPPNDPEPEFHRTVVVEKVSGTVLVRLKGSKRFQRLDAVRGIPLGSTVDVKKGVVRLTSEPAPGGDPQSANFYGGIFLVTQPGGIVVLKLTEALAKCATADASGSARKKPKSRRLWGDGRGRFQTNGQYSSATVRGTKWLVQDSCRGTLTRVAAGVVAVRDRVKKKTVRLTAGKSYLARPPKP